MVFAVFSSQKKFLVVTLVFSSTNKILTFFLIITPCIATRHLYSSVVVIGYILLFQSKSFNILCQAGG